MAFNLEPKITDFLYFSGGKSQHPCPFSSEISSFYFQIPSTTRNPVHRCSFYVQIVLQSFLMVKLIFESYFAYGKGGSACGIHRG